MKVYESMGELPRVGYNRNFGTFSSAINWGNSLIVGPIFVREAMTAPRRLRHFVARSAYGAVLLVLMWTAWQVLVGFQRVQSAGDIARFGSWLFQRLAFIQLGLAMFFAPVVAGSSITSEKDRRTLILLRINLSRSGQVGLLASCRSTSPKYSAVRISTADIELVGWPEPASVVIVTM